MKVILSKEDVKKLMQESFEQGLPELAMSGCVVDWDYETTEKNYGEAVLLCHKEQQTAYTSNVYTKMLEVSDITFTDEDGDEYKLDLDIATKNLQKACENPWFLKEVLKIIPEYDNADACTYHNILQGALFGEVIYG